jgi:ABC-type branched-subunit amino acid transport system substrate-binding protein
MDPIKLGYIGPLTGGAAILGIDASKSIKIAVDDVNKNGGINGRQVKLYLEDDQYDTAKTITAYNKLVNVDKVDNLIVSTYGGLFAVAERANKDGVLLIDSLDCDDQISTKLPDNTFCIAKDTYDLGARIADYATKQNYKKVGILHATVDEFMPSVKDAFAQKFEANGGQVVVESYTKETTDFKTQILKMKDVDAIVMLGYDEIGVAMKQARDLGVNAEYLTIPSVATSPALQTASKGAIEGIHFSFYTADPSNSVAKTFHDKFSQVEGSAPNFMVGADQAYDSAKILFNEVLAKVDASKTQAEQLKQKEALMLGLKNYPGTTGNISMDKDGKIQGIKLYIFELVNGTPTFVE